MPGVPKDGVFSKFTQTVAEIQTGSITRASGTVCFDLNVEQEVTNIAVLNHVALAFDTNLAGFA